MAITSVESYVAYYGAVDEATEVKIEALIPLVEEVYLNIRNAPFDEVGGTITYPSGSEMTANEMINYKLTSKSTDADLQSESIGSYSYSKRAGASLNGFPKGITSSIKRYIRGE